MDHIQPLVDALTIHTKQYKSYGDYSATSLIDPPRVVALTKRHGHEAPMVPQSQVASFIGTGVHNYFEHTLRIADGGRDEYELERRMFDKVEDRMLTGQFDILHNKKHIYDIKTCKTWKTIFDPDKIDWHAQQNIYAWLLHRRGLDVESINVIAVYMDWQQGMALRTRGYPQEAVVHYPLTLWDYDVTEEFIREKIKSHKAAELLDDHALPECTRAERWERFSNGDQIQFAVLPSMQAKRAKRVLSNLEEAYDYCRAQKNVTTDWVIECRYAERTRCKKWCNINAWCNDYQYYKSAEEHGKLNEYIPVKEIL